GRVVRQRVERAAATWDQLGRSADALWNERLLKDVADLDGAALASRDAAFLAASRRAVRWRRWRRWSTGLGTLGVVAVVGIQSRLQAAHERDATVAQARLDSLFAA